MNYNIGIDCFVENVLHIDRHQTESSSLFQANNRLQAVVDKNQLSVLYIKLAERLYDLRHAQGYTSPSAVKYMAKETLTIDVELAMQYLEPEIAETLKSAAWEALEMCKNKINSN